MYDLVIRSALIVDGSGEEPFRGDVCVCEGRVVKVKPFSDVDSARGPHDSDEAQLIIDADGMVLCPGFIDAHSHDDFAAFLEPRLPFKVLQGVTSEVVGNCGIGAAPFPGAEAWFEKLHPGAIIPDYQDYRGYFRRLDEVAPSVNIAVLAGHGALRHSGAPGAARRLERHELNLVSRACEEAVEAGVIGISAGLIYEPGIHASLDELSELCRIVGKSAPLFAVHLRSEADGLLDAVEEAIEISDRAEVGLQLSHHKAHGRNNWGRVRESLALVDEARARGRDVWLDQYPYAAGSTLLKAVMDRGGLDGGPALGHLEPADIVIASCPARPALEGRNLQQLSEEWAVSPQHAAQMTLRAEAGTWVVVHAMSEADVTSVMQHPATMIGSDGLPTIGGRPHPRLWGTFPRVLGVYCRERGALSLQTAVQKMTSLPARRFGLSERGEIRHGYHADLVLFRPEEIGAGASYEEPRRAPTGIVGVWVNGQRTVIDGEHTGARAGRALRRGC